MLRSSIHKRKHLFLMNWTTRIASSMARYCCFVASSLYSKTSILLPFFLTLAILSIHLNSVVYKWGNMPHRRTNLYLTERQLEKLHERSERERLPIAELVRRAVDAYLAWDDPTYLPSSQASNKTRHFH